MLDGQLMNASVVCVRLRLLVEVGAGAANLSRVVTPDVVCGSSSAQRWLRDFEDLTLADGEPHRGDALRALVAHDGFPVGRVLHGLLRPFHGVSLSSSYCAPLGSYSTLGRRCCGGWATRLLCVKRMDGLSEADAGGGGFS